MLGVVVKDFSAIAFSHFFDEVIFVCVFCEMFFRRFGAVGIIWL